MAKARNHPTPASTPSPADLDAAELGLLRAMADECPMVDVELVACFLAISNRQAGGMLDRLEHLGFLVAGAHGAFSLNQAACAALPQPTTITNGHTNYKWRLRHGR